MSNAAREIEQIVREAWGSPVTSTEISAAMDLLAAYKRSRPAAPSRSATIEALEPFASIGELIELETTGFDGSDELDLLVESGHLLERIKVSAFLKAATAIRALSSDGEVR